MRRKLLLGAILGVFGFALVSVLVLRTPQTVSDDPVYSFARVDPIMNAAIEKARSSLPVFWSKFTDHTAEEDSFSLKIAISEGEETEHFWCGEIEGNATKASCKISNEPQVVHSVSEGQRIEVDPQLISDWMYMLNGRIKGGETIRVIIPTLSKDEADYYRSLLADN